MKAKDLWINTFIPFSAAMAAAGTLIPLFILAIGGDTSDIGIFIAIGTAVSLPLAFIWGKLTDDTGKRKIFILIMFISGFGISFGYILVSNLLWLIVMAILTGLLLGAGDTAINMYIYDKYPSSEWEEKISKFHQRSGIGAVAGLALGGLFQLYISNYAIFFMIISILCGISAILGYFMIKDIPTEKVQHELEKIPNREKVLYSTRYTPHEFKQSQFQKADVTKTIFLFFLGVFLIYVAFNLIFTPLPVFMVQDLAILEFLIYWIYLLYFLISAVSYTFVGNLIDKKGNRKVLIIGLFILIIVYSLFAVISTFTTAVVGSPVAIIIFIILLTVGGIALSLLNVAIQNTLPRLIKKDLGEFIGVFNIILGVAAVIGALLSGFIVERFSYTWLFVISVICTCVALIIYYKAVYDINPKKFNLIQKVKSDL